MDKISTLNSLLINNFNILLESFNSKNFYDFNYQHICEFPEMTYYNLDSSYHQVRQILQGENYKFIDKKLSRAIATFVCSAIGDSLGTPTTEFL
jgi:hypothetical protein